MFAEIRTIEMKRELMQAAKNRGPDDNLGMDVRGRLEGIIDLVAED